MNYAETLAYWYLRLNGFFPLSRFVLHRDGNRNYNTDCDLLAIRPPHVWEPVGGNPQDWDAELFAAFNCKIKTAREMDFEPTQTLVLIAQCKGGQSRDIGSVADSFSADRLAYAIKRTGLLPDGQVGEISGELARVKSLEKGKIIFGKLFIVENACENPQENAWVEWRIASVIEFLRRRIHDCADEKRNAWDKFPSDLLQYLIWHPPAAPQR